MNVVGVLAIESCRHMFNTILNSSYNSSFSIKVLYKTGADVDPKYIVIEFFENIFIKLLFCVTAQKNLVNKIFSLKSEAGIVLYLSLIFEQISAWGPYKRGLLKKV